jgi:hypothetical protein
MHELETGGDDDVPGRPLLQRRDLITTSPLSTVVLFETGSWRVEDMTYLGLLFSLSASSSIRDGHRGQELVAAPAQQHGLGARRLL